MSHCACSHRSRPASLSRFMKSGIATVGSFARCASKYSKLADLTGGSGGARGISGVGTWGLARRDAFFCTFSVGFGSESTRYVLCVNFVMIRRPQHGLPPYLNRLVQSWGVSRVAQRPRVRAHGTRPFSYSSRGGACRCEALGRLRAGQVFAALARGSMGPRAASGVVQQDWVLGF